MPGGWRRSRRSARPSNAQPPAVQRGNDQPGRMIEMNVPTGERSYLYSSRSNWYPQPPISDYATARIRITLPAGLACVATGEMDGPPVMLPPQAGAPPRRQFEFVASRPVRYLAFIASRFARADRVTVAFDNAAAEGGRGNTPFATTAPAMGGAVYDSITLTVDANPLQVPRGRQLINDAADIVRFYDSLIGDAPYDSFTIALVEHVQPGGHSPAYFAALNQPLPNTPLRWHNDPVNFEGLPRVLPGARARAPMVGPGGRLAQLPRAVAERGVLAVLRGALCRAPLRRRGVRRHAPAAAQMGHRSVRPGTRLPRLPPRPHPQRQPTVFRALVYNKGAAVLHMLRRLVGDDAFLRGMRRFYVGARFTKVGTEDFRAAMEAETGRSLERFFERWIYGATLPRITFTSRVDTGADGRQEVVLLFEQEGDIFDIPVSVALTYTDRRVQNVLVPITDRTAEMRVPLTGALRSVDHQYGRRSAGGDQAALEGARGARRLARGPRRYKIVEIWTPSR